MDEIEAKFTVPNAAAWQRLREIDRLADYTLGAVDVETLHDTFLDTAGRAILSARFYCRQRAYAGRPGVWITLKALGGAEGALHRREELQLPLPAALPPAEWPAGPVRERVLGWIGAAPLVPLLQLEQVRHVRPVLSAGQPIAELSLDEVRLSAGRRRESFHELEVELTPAGTAADLAAIAAALQAGAPLEPQGRSKFARALAFLEEQPVGLLSPEERAVCAELSRRGDLHGRRARALLALDAGRTQEEAGRQSGMSERRVRYWQAAFRQDGFKIFPPRVLAAARAASPAPERGAAPAAPSAAAPAPAPAAPSTAAAAPSAAAPAPAPATPSAAAPAPAPAAPSAAAPAPAPAAPSAAAPAPAPAVPAPAPAAPFAAPSAAPAPFSAGPLRPDDTLPAAARKVLAQQLQRLVDNEAGVRRGGADNEPVHDMRVATRRMRAALRILGGSLDDDAAAALARDLRRAGRTLGAVRDMDVFQEKAGRYLAALPETARGGLDPLLAAWAARYQRVRQDLLDYLDGERYARLRERLDALLRESPQAAPPAPGAAPRPHRLREVVPVVLYQGLAQVRAYDEWLAGPGVPLERYHQLRIAGKGLRYALEFFRDVLGPTAGPLVERAKGLQDHLGDLQDAVVACGLLRDFLIWGTWGRPARSTAWPATPIVAPGVAAYLAFRQAEIQRLVETFPAAWDPIRGPEFGQLLARSIAVLL